MDLATATLAIKATTAAIGLFDKVSDQVVKFITKSEATPGPPKQHNYTITGSDGTLKVEHQGRTLQVMRGEDLQKLPEEYYRHIKTLEKSLQRHYELWEEVYPHRDDSVDLIANAKTKRQLRDAALTMKDDLTGIVDFLQKIGVMLDDHYIIYRDVIGRYDGTSDSAA
jgi:hypothetical protein